MAAYVEGFAVVVVSSTDSLHLFVPMPVHDTVDGLATARPIQNVCKSTIDLKNCYFIAYRTDYCRLNIIIYCYLYICYIYIYPHVAFEDMSTVFIRNRDERQE